MPSSKTHFIIGSLLGAGLYAASKKLQNQQIDPISMIGMGLLGGVAGLLPDLIEPANSPLHRKTAHSITAVAGLIQGLKKINENPNLQQDQKDFWTILALCYGSHLALDSQTPARLPLY